MKYRVKETNGLFFPQRRILGFWSYFWEEAELPTRSVTVAFEDLRSAEAYIRKSRIKPTNYTRYHDYRP